VENYLQIGNKSAAEAAQDDGAQTVLAWLLGATVVATALRLPFLSHQSLWLDEIFTRDILGSGSLPSLWDHIKATESTPPLYYVIGWLLGGRSAGAMRAIPAVALIASVPVSYLAFRRLVSERAAVATAWIVAVSPILVSYSTDARSYGLFVLTSLLSLWALTEVLDRDTPGRYALWALTSLACVWTHYFGGFLLLGEVLVLLATRPAVRGATAAWSGLILVGLVPLVPLVTVQTGDERAGSIAGASLASRVSTTARQLAMGPNVPRGWLEAVGVAVFGVSVLAGIVLALRTRRQTQLVLLVLTAVTVGTPFLLAVVSIEDRFDPRNVILVTPMLAALAAPAMLRVRAIPLIAYLAVAVVVSVWVATDWRYEQTDWRGALARVEAIEPRTPIVAVTASSSVPVVRTYLGRPALAPAQPVRVRRAWIVIEPRRQSGERALTPGPPLSIPGFSTDRQLQVHGFGLILVGAARPTPLATPTGTIFPGSS
jgi:4-amino-4-deoxy-L-arabinose transferase-like glycosyltransferase